MPLNATSLGIYDIVDPGPPEAPCTRSTSRTDQTSAETGREANMSFMNAVPPRPTETLVVDPNPPHLTTASSTLPSPAQSSLTEPTESPTISALAAERSLSAGLKAAAVVGAALGTAVIICIIFVCMRRRHRHQYPSSDRALLASGWGGSQTPTKSWFLSQPGHAGASRSGLVPPPRLGDRRYLLGSMRRKARVTESGKTGAGRVMMSPGTWAYSGGSLFPTAPICAPTTSRLVPRREKSPRLWFELQQGDRNQAQPHGQKGGRASPPRSGGGTCGSQERDSTSSTGSAAAGKPASMFTHPEVIFSDVSPPPPPPSRQTRSLNRPPRPHDEPLEIPHLVSPASPTRNPLARGIGPPPDRALPSPPAAQPAGVSERGGQGPTNRPEKVVDPSEIGVALGGPFTGRNGNDDKAHHDIDEEPTAAEAQEARHRRLFSVSDRRDSWNGNSSRRVVGRRSGGGSGGGGAEFRDSTRVESGSGSEGTAPAPAPAAAPAPPQKARLRGGREEEDEAGRGTLKRSASTRRRSGGRRASAQGSQRGSGTVLREEDLEMLAGTY